MAIVTPGTLLQNSVVGVSAQYERLRQALVSKSWPSTATNGPKRMDGRGGVYPQNNALNVTAQSTPNMTVNVDRGLWLSQGSESLSQGNYPGFNDATLILNVTASNTTQRIDSVVAYAQDSVYSGATDSGNLAVIAGVAGSGSPPNLIAIVRDYEEIARITVRANTTSILNSDIQNLQHWLIAPGGVSPVLPSELSNPGSYVGDMRIRIPAAAGPSGSLEFWDGTIWRGTQDYDLTDSKTGTVSITLNTYNVICTVNVADPGWPYYVKVSSNSVYASPTSGTAFSWITLDSTSGAALATGSGGTGVIVGTDLATTGADVNLNLTPYTYPSPLTGAHTIRSIVDGAGSGNSGTTIAAALRASYMNVTIVPA